MNEPATSTDEVAQAPGNPLAATALKQLFFSPSAYFRSASLDRGHAWLFVVWISGISSVIGRVDQSLIRADRGGADNGLDAIVGSWYSFWALALGAGLVWACWNWWIFGWWFRARLAWSGASGIDPRQARLVYMFAGFVVNMPSVLYTIAQSIIHPNYRAAWNADSAGSLLIVVCLLWSTVVSWRAVLTTFPVRRTPALWWFLVLPITFYCILFGVLGTLLAVAAGE
jgi:hypothetical protein